MSKIIDRELRHATFKRGRHGVDDVHFIKEIVTYDDGTVEPKLNIVENYKRPFWITKKPYRNHKQVKEAEHIDKLDKFYTTETDMAREITKAIGKPKFGKVTMRDVKSSNYAQYIYGADVESTTMIALEYESLGTKITPNFVGFLDIENHPINKTISVVTFVYRDPKDKHVKINTFILKKELPNLVNVEETAPELFKRVLPKKLPKAFDINDLDFNIQSFDSERELLISLFTCIHSIPIDILTGWGFIYDVTQLKDACLRNDLNPARMFSHPSIPDKHCMLEIKEAAHSKTKENGDVVSVPIELRWHTFQTASMFKMIDYLPAFKYIRLQKPKLKGGYGFDNVMRSLGLSGKLKAVDLPPMSAITWHLTMLQDHQLDYVVYNIWDTLALLYKDEQDTDLQIKLPLFCGISSMDKFNSNPNRIYDDFFALYLEEDKILANKILNKPDLLTLGRDDWTVTVNLWKMDTNYFTNVIEDNYTESISKDNTLLEKLQMTVPTLLLKCRVTAMAVDLDKVSAYPSVADALNVSADGVRRELINMVSNRGVIDKMIMKTQNIGLFTGVASEMCYSAEMFNLPTLLELDEVAIEML